MCSIRSRWPQPQKLHLCLAALATTLLVSCTTTVEKASKSAELTAAVPEAVVVFIGSMADGGEARLSLGTALAMPVGMPRGAPGINEDANALGKFTLEALPAAVKQAALQFSASTKLLPAHPASRQELNKALGIESAGKPILVVQPVSARMECPSGCFVFKLDAKLLPSGDSTVPLWTATMTAPPRASKFHDFSSPGKSVAEALVAQLKADGVVK
jgi:hypothetical protein